MTCDCSTIPILQEIAYYTPLLFPLHDILFPIVHVLLYSVLCIYIFKVKGFKNGKLDKTQLQVQVYQEGIQSHPLICSYSTLLCCIEFHISGKTFTLLRIIFSSFFNHLLFVRAQQSLQRSTWRWNFALFPELTLSSPT